MDTLHTALKAYSTRPRPPPMSPAPIAAPYLIETLREPILDSIRYGMRLYCEAIRKNTEILVEAKNQQLFMKAETKCKETLHILSQIRNWIEKNHNQGAQAQHSTSTPT